jgi:hypothetical protein
VLPIDMPYFKLQSPRIKKKSVRSPSCERQTTFQRLAGMYYCLDIPGSLHVGAKIGWRQYFCLAQIFEISMTYFSALAKSAIKLKKLGRHDILMVTSEQIHTNV